MKYRLVGAGVRGNTVIIGIGDGRDSGWFHSHVELTPKTAISLAAWLLDFAKIAQGGGADNAELPEGRLGVHVELLAAAP